MSQPLVSAIIIFFNEERFLAKAIDSVLAQTYEHWELLLVDDGSNDRSAQIASSYVERFPERMRYLDHPGHVNRGTSAARNLGLSQARGDFIGFLDADDIWCPTKLEEQLTVLDAHPRVSMTYGRTLIWRQWGDPKEAHWGEDEFCDLGVTPDTVINPPQLLISLIENRVQTPTTCNALMRKEAILRVGGFEDRFRGMFEDQVFFMKLCLAETVFVSSACWAQYRQRPDSCSARAEAAGEVPRAHRQLLAWLAGYLRQHDVHTKAVWRAWDRQRWGRYWRLKIWRRWIERSDVFTPG
jgi:glycosyltransferase involved in cell wall biosynthesis